MTIISRCFIVSVRYGFMSSLRYKLSSSKANLNWIIADFLFLGWLKLSPKTAKNEIAATRHRLQINDDEFKFNFTQDLPLELEQRFSKDDYYINNKEGISLLKTKVATQRQLFRQRKKPGASFIEDELEIVHSSRSIKDVPDLESLASRGAMVENVHNTAEQSNKMDSMPM